MSEELRPCPFCSSRGLNGIEYIWGDSPTYYIQCVSCDTRGRVGHTIEEANKLWNTRPTEDSLRADLARKDAEIAALEEYAKTGMDNLYSRIPGPLGLGMARKEELQELQKAHDAARAKLAEVREGNRK